MDMDDRMMKIEKHLNVIMSCSLFSGTSENEIIKSLEILEYKFSSYNKNDFLIQYEDGFDCFGLVLSGRVKVMVDDIEGNTAIMAEVTPGKTFGESLCILKRDGLGIYICAAEDTEVIWLSPKNLYLGNNTKQIQNLEKRFVEMLAQRTLAMNNRIQILSKLSLREKIITYLTFSKQNVNDKKIDVSLSREEMAIYFGTNRSALSRELSNMKKDGLIDYTKNHFLIKF